MSEVRYLTAAQVAERYGLTLNWVYGCRSLPRRKIGKYLRFRLDELEIWEERYVEHSRLFTFKTPYISRVVRKVVPTMSHKRNYCYHLDGVEFPIILDIL